MPEFYSSIGEAIGAAMAHNIRLAHRRETTNTDTPPQARHLPPPSAEPSSVPGMTARLTQTATPGEVAAIINEVNGSPGGALPQVTELVAAAADWSRVRLDFDDPHHNPTFEVWQQLAAATRTLRDVQQDLEAAVDGIAACPAELSDPRHHEMVDVLRTREPLHGIPGDNPAADTAPPAAHEPVPDRQRAATAASPNAAPAPAPPPPAGTSAPAPNTAPAPCRAR